MAQRDNGKYMTKGEYLVNIMEVEGVPFSGEEKNEAIKLIDRAVDSGRIEFLRQKDKVVGFVTYSEKMFLEYCFLYKEFRKSTSLLGLRKTFRSMGDKFRWNSRRRGRLCIVR